MGNRSGLVSLLTDFGTSDTYVGQIKAVMLGIAPEVTFIDLTHEIPAQDVLEAAFQLATAWSAFPVGTVHLVVVDPGVGTPRRPIAFEFAEHIFVMPDNGLASLVLNGAQPTRLVVLDKRDAQRARVSRTFHGRDVFGPVAARLAAGQPLDEVGSAADPATMVALDLPPLERGADWVRGPVVSIDHFGNCRTLIHSGDLAWPADQVWVRCGTATIRGIADTYGAVEEGRTLALFGSHGGLEIAVRMGSAARAWEIHRGMVVEVRNSIA